VLQPLGSAASPTRHDEAVDGRPDLRPLLAANGGCLPVGVVTGDAMRLARACVVYLFAGHGKPDGASIETSLGLPRVSAPRHSDVVDV